MITLLAFAIVVAVANYLLQWSGARLRAEPWFHDAPEQKQRAVLLQSRLAGAAIGLALIVLPFLGMVPAIVGGALLVALPQLFFLRHHRRV